MATRVIAVDLLDLLEDTRHAALTQDRLDAFIGVDPTLTNGVENEFGDPGTSGGVDLARLPVHEERTRQLAADVATHFVTTRLAVTHFLDTDDAAFRDVLDVRVVVVELGLATNLETTFMTIVAVLPGHDGARFVLRLLCKAWRSHKESGNRSQQQNDFSN